MKRWACMLLALMLPLAALADPVTLGNPLEGEVYWPDDSTAENAVYTYRYAYPSAEGSDPVAEGINATFTYLVDDAVAFTVPINGESLEDPSQKAFTEITSEVTYNGDDYFSVLVRRHSVMDGEDYDVYAGYVFTHSGQKTGLVISLPYLLGILGDRNATDTWLQDRQTAKADNCVREMLWEAIEENAQGRTLLPDATYEYFSAMFYPEEDFYLDATGNPVFFIQPGVLTPEADGVLLFPLSLESILDEI